MKLAVLAGLLTPLLFVSTLAQNARPPSQSKSFLQVSGKYQPIFALCDALEAPKIIAVTLPDKAKRAQVFSYSKKIPTDYAFQVYELGNADPGAGQVYFSLTPKEGIPVPKDAGYFLHQVSLGVLEDPTQALTPTWTSVKTREVNSSCRYQMNTRLMGFSSKRSYLITETPQGELRYQTFDFANTATAQKLEGMGINRSSTPSLLLEGGCKQVTSTQQMFRFQNKGYTYTISVARLGQNAGARVRVKNGEKTVLNEVLIGYVYSERR